MFRIFRESPSGLRRLRIGGEPGYQPDASARNTAALAERVGLVSRRASGPFFQGGGSRRRSPIILGVPGRRTTPNSALTRSRGARTRPAQTPRSILPDAPRFANEKCHRFLFKPAIF